MAPTPGHDTYYWDLNLPAFAQLVPSSGRRTLDVGCGEGRIGAGDHPPRYEEVTLGDAVALPWLDGEFDLVVAFMSLHDMNEPERVIGEIARVLEPGGVLCMAIVHPLNRPAAHLDDYFSDQRFSERLTLKGLTMTFEGVDRPLESYTRALSDHGFVIDELREPRS